LIGKSAKHWWRKIQINKNQSIAQWFSDNKWISFLIINCEENIFTKRKQLILCSRQDLGSIHWIYEKALKFYGRNYNENVLPNNNEITRKTVHIMNRLLMSTNVLKELLERKINLWSFVIQHKMHFLYRTKDY
jgi:hypothetical protein